MKFFTDSFFKMGSTHSICQDYAIDGNINNIHYAILSDGCSSSKLVDVGARILVHCFKNALQSLPPDKYILEDIMSYIKQEVRHIRFSLGLPLTAFDCTIQAAFVNKDKLHVFNLGDGYTVIRGTGIEIINHSYNSNAPYYHFSYGADPVRSEEYFKHFNQTVNIVNGAYGGDEYKAPQYLMPKEILDKKLYYEVYDINDLFSRLHSNTITVSVYSDGLTSFIKGKDYANYDDIINNFTNYKNFRHDFVSNRCKHFIEVLNNEGFNHYDDFSCAAITIHK